MFRRLSWFLIWRFNSLLMTLSVCSDTSTWQLLIRWEASHSVSLAERYSSQVIPSALFNSWSIVQALGRDEEAETCVSFSIIHRLELSPFPDRRNVDACRLIHRCEFCFLLCFFFEMLRWLYLSLIVVVHQRIKTCNVILVLKCLGQLLRHGMALMARNQSWLLVWIHSRIDLFRIEFVLILMRRIPCCLLLRVLLLLLVLCRRCGCRSDRIAPLDKWKVRLLCYLVSRIWRLIRRIVVLVLLL